MTKKLQALIDAAAKANTKAFEANEKLVYYCIEKYGVEPSEIDADDILDSVMGASGACSGMTAEAFDECMRSAMEF